MLRRIGIGFGVTTVALVLIGQGIFLWTAKNAIGGSPGTSKASHLGKDSPFSQKMASILTNALGYGDHGNSRFHIDSVRANPRQRALKDVAVTWRIQSNLLEGTIGNGAQVDAYTILRGIYTSHLPVESVVLDGTFPVARGSRHARNTVVMRLRMNRRIGRIVSKAGWDNLSPQSVWPMVTRLHVDPDFQPQPTE